jgi:AAA+ superfamily predicted ATPase
MWYQFENMRFLSYPSSNTFLNILVYNSIESPSKNLRLSMYTSKGWVIWVKSIILGYLVKNKFIANNFFRTYGTDIQATKTNLVVHSLITRHQLVSKYNLWNFHKNTQNIKLKKNKPVYYEGIHFLQKWSRRYARCSQFLQSQPSGLNKLNSLNDFFFDMEYENQKRNLKKNNVFILQNRNKPRILSETITLTKRWLLIGTTDTGKSYIIKQLAAATYIPLVHISLKTIRHSTPDFKYNKLKKYNKWIKQLADRGLLLFNVLELAKILAPCIFWISDLHEFHATYSTKNKKEKIYDASLLLTILLKVMGNDLLPVKNSNITFIGSTNSPSLLDPKIVSQHRLDLIINLRKPSCYQRKQIFTNLLNEKGFSINTKNCFNEIGNQTIGHSIGDIATLVNETLLINIENSNASVTTDLIRLASDRQVSKHSANNKILETETIQYKIGKAIIQTILIPWKPLLSITKKHDLWKTRFYYLSNAFLEFSIEKSIVTELVILSYIINCLAGSAARDAWILYENNLTIHNISINKKLKHDLSIASNLLQSLLLDFPMQEIHFINSDIIKSSQTKNNFYYIKKNEYSLNFFQRFSSYIYWSYRIERLSLNWTLLFDHINQSKKEINKQLLSTTKKTDNSILLKEEISHKQLPYERRITKSQEKRAQKLNDTFDELMVDTTLKSMGFPWFSEYVMNYDALNLSILLLETRTIWNPPVITPSYSVLFFDRDLTINRNILTKIYITYGEKFKTEKLNPKRIKKQVFLSDDTVNNYNANQISNNSKINTITKTDNFHYYKQMVKSQANLEQLQLQPPVYLYQFWTFQDNIQNIDDANFINHRRNLKNQILQNQEILLYGILVEIYDWLVKFFIMNHNISHNIEEQLLANGILNREYIEKIIENTKLE